MTNYLTERSKELTIGGRELKVLIISDYEEIKECDILFVQKASKKKLSEILAAVEDLTVLTVADTKDYAKKGIMINLFKSGTRYRFNVNHTVVQKSGLILSSKLLKYAVEIF
jgi:bisphosphoglycerate-independent phosphoglycerate mutase (AlkP superfamily)